MNIPPKHQIIIIDGWESFASDIVAQAWLEKCDWDLMEKMPSWKKWLADGLADNFQVIRPNMPNTMNAKYPEWKIWFEKYLRYIHIPRRWEQSTLDRVMEKNNNPQEIPKLILIGHSLGATFIAKYLSETLFPRQIDVVHLISPAFDDTGLVGESLSTFRFLPQSLANIHRQAKSIHIWGSTDDNLVPYDHSVRFHVNLFGSFLHTFHDRGHFVGQSHFVELFQEVLKSSDK